MQVTDNYPFTGALTCYRRARKLLSWMGENGYVNVHKKGNHRYCTVDPEMSTLVDALNKGDEETIKSYLIDSRFFKIIHSED